MEKTKGYVSGYGVSLLLGDAWKEVKQKEDRARLYYSNYPKSIQAPTQSSKIGKINDLDPVKYLNKDALKLTNRFVAMAVNGAGDALDQAGYLSQSVNRKEIGCIVGLSRPEFLSYSKLLHILFKLNKISPVSFPLLSRNIVCGQICIQFGLMGYAQSIGSSSVSGAQSIIWGLRLIQRKRIQKILVGGVETLSMLSLHQNKVLYDEYYKGLRGVLDIDELVPSEGASFCMLESEDTSGQGVFVQEYMIGRLDSKNMEEQYSRIIQQFCEQSGVKWSDISMVCCSVSSVYFPHEQIEWEALNLLNQRFDSIPLLSAPKVVLGEAEACLSNLQLVNAYEHLVNRRAIGQISWKSSEKGEDKEGLVLVSYLDRAFNYVLYWVKKEVG